MIIPPLRMPNRTSDNKTIVPDTGKAVTSQEGSIGGVLRRGTSVLYLDGRDVCASLASACGATLCFLNHA
jgi:hypothetical protein